MTLDFKVIETVSRDGKEYFLQRADVTRSGDFWSAWRNSNLSNTDLVTLKREALNGRPVWALYRLFPKALNTPFGKLQGSYTLRNSSKLLPYQPVSVSALCLSITKRNCAIDASDTGTGKTYSGLAVARDLVLRPGIICKIGGMTGWKKACEYMGIDPLFIMNWELAKSQRFKFTERIELQGILRTDKKKLTFNWKVPSNTLLIFDECHKGCNHDSQNFQLMIASKGIPSILASATIADRPSQLKAIFYLLGIKSFEEFSLWMKELGTFPDKFDNDVSLDDLGDMLLVNKMLFPEYGYRLSYNSPEVKMYFPDVVIQSQIVDLPTKALLSQNKEYEELLKKVDEYKEQGKQAEILVANLRYRQAAELHKVPVLVSETLDLLYSGKSVVVFVNYRDTLAALAKELKTKSMIFGSQESYGIDRDKVISDFQDNKTRLILAMIDAGGTSINLHDLKGGHQRISLICPTYSAKTLKQVMGRTHRAGSKTTPIIKLIYAAGTIEEKVAERVNDKINNIAALNDGDLMEKNIFNLVKEN